MEKNCNILDDLKEEKKDMNQTQSLKKILMSKNIKTFSGKAFFNSYM